MKRNLIGDLAWLFSLLVITAFLILPQTHRVFIQLTGNHPYLMGFIKFAILATMGELLALRLAKKAWIKPVGLIFKIVVWGLIGVLITFMFPFYSAGVSAMTTQLNISPGNQLLSIALSAFLTSVIMNLTFGIVFMAMHRMSDTYIEMRFNHKKPSLKGTHPGYPVGYFHFICGFQDHPAFLDPSPYDYICFTTQLPGIGRRVPFNRPGGYPSISK